MNNEMVGGVQDVLKRIGQYLRGMWRFRWAALLTCWAICIAGWALLYFIPNQYESTARVYLDTQSKLKPLLNGLTVTTDISSTARDINAALLSRPNLEAVARETDLSLRAKNDLEFDQLIRSLEKKIELRETAQRNMYTITYTDIDPQMAKRVVHALLTGFVERTLGNNRVDTRATLQFLEDQIREYEQRLEASEQTLKEFKQRNVGLMPSAGQDYYQRLQQALSELETASLELREIEIRAKELRGQLEGEVPTFGLLERRQESTRVKEIKERIQAKQNELDTLLLNFTENHPDVAGLRHTIGLLEQERDRLMSEEANQIQFSSTPDQNPVYQQMKIELSKAESQAASLRVRVKEYRSRVDDLREKVDTIPRVEAELAKLSRDYDVIKQNYESLLKRREQARLSKEVDQSADDVQFKIIDPPRVPVSPVSPKRVLLMTVVLVFGLLAGIALSFVLSQLKPVFFSVRDLMQATGLPVYGGVSRVWTPKQKRQRTLKLMAYSLAGFSLFLTYGGMLLMHSLNLAPWSMVVGGDLG